MGQSQKLSRHEFDVNPLAYEFLLNCAWQYKFKVHNVVEKEEFYTLCLHLL